jgi:hypothetical protein
MSIPRVRAWLASVLLIALGHASGAAPAHSRMAEKVDQKTVHASYNEGDFEAVTAALTGFMTRNPSFSHEDSVFIAKHLAVVYAANPQTREKGRYYMYQLLELVPSAKLVDMFVSEEIDRIFEKVREEFLSRHPNTRSDSGQVANSASVPEGAMAAPARPRASEPPAASRETYPSSSASPSPTQKSSHLGLWAAGGAAVVAGAAAAYFVYQKGPETNQPHYHVPSTVTGK